MKIDVTKTYGQGVVFGIGFNYEEDYVIVVGILFWIVSVRFKKK